MTNLTTDLAFSPLPAVDYVSCDTSQYQSCAATTGATIDLVIVLKNVPTNNEYRPSAATSAATFLPDCSASTTDVCGDVAVNFGSEGAGVVSSVTRKGSEVEIAVASPQFSAVGTTSVSVVVLEDTRYSITFDQNVVANGSPKLIGDYSAIYRIQAGGELVSVEASNMDVTQVSELQVTYNGVSSTVSQFALGDDSITFSLTTSLVASSFVDSSVAVVISKVGSSSSVTFNVFIDAGPQPQFDSALPPYILITSGGSRKLIITTSNVKNFVTDSGLRIYFIYGGTNLTATGVAAYRPTNWQDSGNNRLYVEVDTPAAIADGEMAGEWTIQLRVVSDISGYIGLDIRFGYTFRLPDPQLLAVTPNQGYTGMLLSCHLASVLSCTFACTSAAVTRA